MDRIQERFQAIKGLCVRFSTNEAPNITRLAEIIDIGMGGGGDQVQIQNKLYGGTGRAYNLGRRRAKRRRCDSTVQTCL